MLNLNSNLKDVPFFGVQDKREGKKGSLDQLKKNAKGNYSEEDDFDIENNSENHT